MTFKEWREFGHEMGWIRPANADRRAPAATKGNKQPSAEDIAMKKRRRYLMGYND